MVKFLADEMLGTVAKWLRIMGFDTEYAKDLGDNGILKTASEDGRILLTRDRELVKRAEGRGIKAAYLPNADLEKDLRRILDRYPPDKDGFMTRCTLCNSELVEVDKDSVKERVPRGVYERQNRFWYCHRCDKYYWEESHRERMKEFLRKLNE